MSTNGDYFDWIESEATHAGIQERREREFAGKPPKLQRVVRGDGDADLATFYDQRQALRIHNFLIDLERHFNE